MILQNHEKKKKFKFEEMNGADFSWDFNPESSLVVKDPAYGRFLKNVYTFDRSNCHLNKERDFIRNFK